MTLSGRERVVARGPAGIGLADVSSGGPSLIKLVRMGTEIAALAPGEARERELSERDFSWVADLSPDGRTLVGVDEGVTGARASTYIRRTDGSPAVWLGEGDPEGLSPDGRWVLARVGDAAKETLALLPAGPGETRALPRGTIAEYSRANWLPDGRRVVFAGAEPQRGPRLWVQDVDGGVPRAITPEEVGLPSIGSTVSPDGSRIVGLDADGSPVLCPLEGGEPAPVSGLDPGDIPIRWTADGRGLFFVRPEEPALVVYHLDLASGRSRVFREILASRPKGMLGHYRVAITPDGRAYAYAYARIFTDLFLAEGLR